MNINDYVIEAKKNNVEKKEFLVNYFKPIFKKLVVRIWGEKAYSSMAPKLPYFIDEFLENGANVSIYDFLFYKVTHSYTKNKEDIGTKIDYFDDKKSNYIIEHYATIFVNKIGKFNKILTKEQLERFSYTFIKSVFYKPYTKDVDLRIIMNAAIANEVKRYEKDSEKLIKRYVLLRGIEDNIVDYYANKYRDLLDDRSLVFIKDYLLKIYDELIIETLYEFKAISCNIGTILEEKIYKVLREKKDLKNSCYKLAQEGDENAINKLLTYYSNIKLRMYDYYKDKINISNDCLINMIDLYYEKCTRFYIKKFGNKNINQYSKFISTNLKNCLEYHYKAYVKFESQKEDIEIIYKIYFKKIDRSLNKLDAYVSKDVVKKILVSTYSVVAANSVIKRKENNMYNYITRALNHVIFDINNYYSYDIIMSLKENFKEGNDDNLCNVIDNLTDYYLCNYELIKEEYEFYIIKALHSLYKNTKGKTLSKK